MRVLCSHLEVEGGVLAGQVLHREHISRPGRLGVREPVNNNNSHFTASRPQPEATEHAREAGEQLCNTET